MSPEDTNDVRSIAASGSESPLRGGAASEARDATLVARAVTGDRAAIEALLRRHQDWVFTIALRMLGDRALAEDCTQEALLRVVTRLGQFEQRASFRTWAYRIVTNAVLDEARARGRARRDLKAFATDLEAFPDGTLDGRLGPDGALLHEETRMRCMTGMLLCLDEDQRIAYLLVDMLDVSSADAAEILGISHAAARKRVERARRDLASFVFDHCGLVRPENPCRCENKTRGLIDRGLVDPERLVFARRGWERAEVERPQLVATIDVAARRLRELMRDQPVGESIDVSGHLRDWLSTTGLRARDRVSIEES